MSPEEKFAGRPVNVAAHNYLCRRFIGYCASHGVGGWRGILSLAVSDGQSLVMAVADLLFSRLVGSKGLVAGVSSRLYSSFHRDIIPCLGCDLSQLSVVRVHWHSLSFRPAFAAMSGCSIPLMS